MHDDRRRGGHRQPRDPAIPVRTVRRSPILSAGMIACHARLQQAWPVVHLVAKRLQDLAPMLCDLKHNRTSADERRNRGDRSSAPIRMPIRDFHRGRAGTRSKAEAP
jgi:hypothetical protein